MVQPNLAYLLGKTQASVGAYFEGGTAVALTTSPPGTPLRQAVDAELARQAQAHPLLKRDLARVAAVLRTWNQPPPYEPRLPTEYADWNQHVSQQVRSVLADSPIASAYYLLGYVVGDLISNLQVAEVVLRLLVKVPADRRLLGNLARLAQASERCRNQLIQLSQSPAFAAPVQAELVGLANCMEKVPLTDSGKPPPPPAEQLSRLQRNLQELVACVEKLDEARDRVS